MTIEFVGHVQSMDLEIGEKFAEKIAVKLRVEAARSRNDIVIIADQSEIGMYYPGMPVVVQVRPGPGATK